MSKIVRIAAIGAARGWDNLPPELRDLYRRTVGYVTQKQLGLGNEVWLHTGAAQGADQAGAEVALALGARVKLFLPRAGHEGEWVFHVERRYPGKVQSRVYNPATDGEWWTSVTRYHPYYSRRPELLGGGKHQWFGMLHARNWGILMEPRVDVVIALPEKGPDGGGTGQGIRIARGQGVLCYNLSLEVPGADRPNEKGRAHARAAIGDYQVALGRKDPPVSQPQLTLFEE